MENNFNVNAVNQLDKGSIIFREGESVELVCLVLKGRVLIKNKGMQIVVGSGNFLGSCDLFDGKYQASYLALENLMLFVFSAEHEDNIKSILDLNKDYKGLVIASNSRTIREVDKVYSALAQGEETLNHFLREYYEKYRKIGESSGYNLINISLINEINDFELAAPVSDEVLNYYRECSGIPLDIQKTYYSYGNTICFRHLKEQADTINRIIASCVEITGFIIKYFSALINKNGDCLFDGIFKLEMNILSSSGKNDELMGLMDAVIDMINKLERLLIDKAGIKLEVDRDYMERAYYRLLSGSTQLSKNELALEEGQDDMEVVRQELGNSLYQILQYSGLITEKKEELIKSVDEYRQMKDRGATDDGARKLRKHLSKLYYELYQVVFLKAYDEKNNSKLINLFLNYGFLDDKLLTEEQLKELYYIHQEDDVEGPCNIYNMREWLTAIYENKKEPSKSEFDMDYSEMLRAEKRTKKLTDAQIRELENNNLKKLEYEIKNMFLYNNRIVSGQMSVFVPMLHEDVFMGRVTKALILARDVNAAVNRIKMVDFSVFCRESVYSNTEKGILKEYIIQEVFPDIIMFPTYGDNGIMWQEITGKRRSSEGRFLLPAFTDASLDDIMIRLFGKFRWELCRSIQGTSWNNLQYPSLTAEYSDYIQFYRKNRDLTEEKKEKLKLQIQKARGNLREMFVGDYIAWIKYEAQGSIRLNKIVREIMATYCPLNKSMREKLETQPLFADAMSKYNREKLKKVRELELRMRGLEKDNAEITHEILDTMEFYRNK